MTAVLDPPELQDVDAPVAAPEVEPDDGAPVRFAEAVRPLAVAALVTMSAGFMVGGIFGSWTARVLAAAAGVLGVAWSFLAVRSRRRPVVQALLVPVAFGAGLLSLVPTTDGPARVFHLIGSAVHSGRLLRPPVPFDPGWRVVLILLLSGLGLATGWLAVGMQRPKLALAAPLPLLGLAAISQPAEGEFVAAMVGFLPVLLALGVLFGGDGRVSELGTAFEIKRAIRSAPLLVGGVVLLVILGQSNFLFPKPAFNPAEKPQKPKSIPLGKVRDRVLFEVQGDVTGPWRTGVLDVYDGQAWRLPPFDTKRLKGIPKSGVVDATRIGDKTVSFTIGDLGTSSVVPGVAGPTRVNNLHADVVFDNRTGVVRMRRGRVPPGLTYSMELPTYPTGDQLKNAGQPGKVDRDFTYVPKPPPAVKQLLDSAPTNPWQRLDFLRAKLNAVVVASGAGVPSKAVPPSKVEDLLVGTHEGSPFEIVATEALLARWAGVPSRIGFGFDGVNDENGKKTVRPKNGANWLEVYFEGYGWVPLVGTPPKAKASLETDKNTKFDPTIVPSDDVAVELYLPVELKNFKLLYQRLRSDLFHALPFVALALGVYLLTPAARRLLRRRKRRLWASANGLRHEIAVEYCEFRDAATDLNLGNIDDTPLEFLLRVADDDEHGELAWLVTRVMYGDMAFTVSEHDVDRATEMAASLRRRMARAQPFQSRALAFVSRASLQRPYTVEVPNVSAWRTRLSRRSRSRSLVGSGS